MHQDFKELLSAFNAKRDNENSRQTNNSSAERVKDAEPKNLPRNPGKGIDDDLS